MFNNTNDHDWQFHVEDKSQLKDNGRAYFEARANEMAATIGCNLVGSKNVQLELVRSRWTVTGTAVLDSGAVIQVSISDEVMRITGMALG